MPKTLRILSEGLNLDSSSECFHIGENLKKTLEKSLQSLKNEDLIVVDNFYRQHFLYLQTYISWMFFSHPFYSGSHAHFFKNNKWSENSRLSQKPLSKKEKYFDPLQQPAHQTFSPQEDLSKHTSFHEKKTQHRTAEKIQTSLQELQNNFAKTQNKDFLEESLQNLLETLKNNNRLQSSKRGLFKVFQNQKNKGDYLKKMPSTKQTSALKSFFHSSSQKKYPQTPEPSNFQKIPQDNNPAYQKNHPPNKPPLFKDLLGSQQPQTPKKDFYLGQNWSPSPNDFALNLAFQKNILTALQDYSAQQTRSVETKLEEGFLKLEKLLNQKIQKASFKRSVLSFSQNSLNVKEITEYNVF